MNYSKDTLRSSDLNFFAADDSSVQDIKDNYGKRLVYNIVEDICQQQDGRYTESTSHCLSHDHSTPSKYSVDCRLEYWKDMLRQRREAQQEVPLTKDNLFNRPSTLDNRDEGTMLDTANDQEHKGQLRKLTAPQGIRRSQEKGSSIQRTGRASENIQHQPSTKPLGQIEQHGEGKWKRLRRLEHRTKALFPKIERLPQFFPDINKLKVEGKKLSYVPKVDLQSSSDSKDISSSSSTIFRENYSNAYLHNAKNMSTISDLGLLINGTPYRCTSPEFSPIIDRSFVCNPFERHLRTILRFENCGPHVLRFRWKRVNFFAYNSTLLDTDDNELVLDPQHFVLKTGDVCESRVLFQPRRVSIVKQKWLLESYSRLCEQYNCGLTLKLHGKCTPPTEYIQLLEKRIQGSLQRFRKPSLLGNIPKSGKEHDMVLSLCPYQRILDEREIFNQTNVGFHCNSYANIELLKEFFEKVKISHSKQWNLSIDMLVKMICLQSDMNQRLSHFKELQRLLKLMRGKATNQWHKDSEMKKAERKLTRFIYVRGTLSNGIEVWEQNIWTLKTTLLKLALQRYHPRTVIEEEENVLTLMDITNMKVHGASSITYEQNTQAEATIFAKLKRDLGHSKYFRDAMYMQTYSQLCDIAENIVSVIESTELV